MGVAALTALALPLRRVWPGPVFGWTILAAAVLAVWPTHGALFPVALAIALYTVAATMRRREAVVAAVLVAGVVIAVVGHDGTRDWALAVSDAAGFAAAVLIVGLYVSTRRAYLAELRDRAQRMERERDQNSALAAAVERARIAREMHDSVAHHLTVIVALSDGALAAVARAPDQASEAIQDVSRTAREALAETRRLFGVLGPGPGQSYGSRCPAWRTSTISWAGSGRSLPVRYERGGSAGDLPPGLQLTVFRLVQEALTNTMKHACPGARATVRLQLTPAEVCVEVEDDGTGSAGEGGAAGGGRPGCASGSAPSAASWPAAPASRAAGGSRPACTPARRPRHDQRAPGQRPSPDQEGFPPGPQRRSRHRGGR